MELTQLTSNPPRSVGSLVRESVSADGKSTAPWQQAPRRRWSGCELGRCQVKARVLFRHTRGYRCCAAAVPRREQKLLAAGRDDLGLQIYRYTDKPELRGALGGGD